MGQMNKTYRRRWASSASRT